jgi:hypothetical protein
MLRGRFGFGLGCLFVARDHAAGEQTQGHEKEG